MPQKSTRIGNVLLTVSEDFKKLRQERRRQRYDNAYQKLTWERVASELETLESFIEKERHSNCDCDVDLRLCSELKSAYLKVFDKSAKGLYDQWARIINLELFVLLKLIADYPLPIVESSFVRLEDLYWDWELSFFNDKGEANEKLEDIGRVIEIKSIPISWSKFPVMETLMVRQEVFMKRKLERAADEMWVVDLLHGRKPDFT